MFDRIRNYFRKRKEQKKYIEYRKAFFETTQRECDCFEESIMSNIGYCNYNKKQYLKCNPYRCRFMIAKLAEFDKEWKKEEEFKQHE